MADKRTEADALPVVGLHEPWVAGNRLDEQVGVERLVMLVGVVVGFVAPVVGAVRHDLLGDEVAEGCWAIVHVVGALKAVHATGQGELLVQRHQRGGSARRIQKAVPQEPVRRVIDRGFLGPTPIVLVLDGRHIHLHQVRSCDGVVRRPSVVTGQGPVVEVSGVDGGAGEVVADGVKEGFVPLPGHAGFTVGLAPCNRHAGAPKERGGHTHRERAQGRCGGQVVHRCCQLHVVQRLNIHKYGRKTRI